MIDFKLTEDGDLFLSDEGELATVTGPEELAQRIATTLNLVRGEWFLEITRGLPWQETILTKHQDTTTVDAVLRAEIASIEGVAQVLAYASEYDPQSRTYRADFTVLWRDESESESRRISGAIANAIDETGGFLAILGGA